MGIRFRKLENGWVVVQYSRWKWGAPLYHGLILRSHHEMGSQTPLPDFSRKNEKHHEDMWALLVQQLGENDWLWYQPRQVHGKRVLYNPDPGVRHEKADGVLTTRAGLLVGVSVADCFPIWLYDRESQAIGVVHAGWRGTVQGILVEAIETLIAQGSSGRQIDIVIGPGIQQCCFEVKIDVLEEIEQRYPDLIHYVVKFRNGQFFVDLIGLNILLARRKRISRASIHPIRLCTSCNRHLFYSHRRGDSGRMLAFIGRVDTEPA